MTVSAKLIACLLLLATAWPIAPFAQGTEPEKVPLKQVAIFPHQVTGVTVSETNRIFVTFPRWHDDVPVSLAEVQKDGSIRPYPDEEWNKWRNANQGELPPDKHFVVVQSVVADGRGSLWVVDPAAPNAEKVVPGGPKVVQIDLQSNRVKRVFAIGPDVAGPASYLNDIRIAPDGSYAYLTDSGAPGGLVVLNLATGAAARRLSGDASTQAEKGVQVVTDGKPLRRPDGRQPMFNADGIALSADGKWLYWQALTGKMMRRIDTALLRADAPDLVRRVETVASLEPVDGLWMDRAGRLYLSSIADNAVKVLMPDKSVRTLVSDELLRWPDTFAAGPDGTIYVTASRIQDSPWFRPEGWKDRRFILFSFTPRF